MTASELRVMVRQALAQAGANNQRLTDPDILTEINNAHRWLCEKIVAIDALFPLYTRTATVLSVDNTQDYPLPVDMFFPVRSIRYGTAPIWPTNTMMLDAFNTSWRDATQGTPALWLDLGLVVSLATLAFDSGGTHQLKVGDVITGESSHNTALVSDISVSSATWSAGTATGTLTLQGASGTFQDNEHLDVGTYTNVADANGNSTAGPTRPAFSVYPKPTGSSTDFYVDGPIVPVASASAGQIPMLAADSDTPLFPAPFHEILGHRSIYILASTFLVNDPLGQARAAQAEKEGSDLLASFISSRRLGPRAGA